MPYAAIILILVGAYLIYKMTTTSAPVEVQAAELGTDGQIEAIEYFWRPG